MYLSASQARSLSHLMTLFAECDEEVSMRTMAAPLLLDLLSADYYASYVWQGDESGFGRQAYLNMSADNLANYRAYYQFHDPVTPQLQLRRHATHVNEVISQRELVRTEFFNDFLHRDGLWWGLNLYAWSDGRNIGDIRIWRGKRRENFGESELSVLEMIRPAFVASLRRLGAGGKGSPAPDALVGARADGALDVGPGGPGVAASARDGFALAMQVSQREWEVGCLVAQGLSDKEIARRLAISFSTVRCHVNSLFSKLGVHGRGRLAQVFSGQVQPTR